MCGICGIVAGIDEKGSSNIHKMVSQLRHRGPNASAVRLFDVSKTKVVFGHTRLSIIDLTDQGIQPMEYNDWSITYNGEVYNYLELKEELKKLSHKFISESDTEVILHAFEEWGIEAVNKFIGMFAMSVLNKNHKKIYFIRDRVGVKPLYYYVGKNFFLFASELKSILVHPSFKKIIDESSLRLYFDYGYIPAPYSIFKNCFKVMPGTILTYNLLTEDLKETVYWTSNDYYSKPKFDIGYLEAKTELHKIFKSAFTYRMVSDVPVGVFLSGGYDSTLVASILQDQLNSNINTFTIGFEKGNNEAPYAKKIANHLGTNHTEYIFTSKDAQEIIPELPFYYDEPFFDSSSLPTIMVSRLAKKDVTVALSADGGDEIFGGYRSYPSLVKRLHKIDRIPNNLKKPVSYLLKQASLAFEPRNIGLAHRLKGISNSLDKDVLEQARKLFHQIHTLPEYYEKNIFKNKASKFKSCFEDKPNRAINPIELAMAIDYRMYLPNDILTKVDRATMSTSLEGREPLLDHRIIEFAAQLPLDYKIRGDRTKIILKDIVYEYIPKALMDRSKTGFSIPIYSWLRNDLSYLLDEYLSREALEATKLFNVEFVLKVVSLFKIDRLHYVNIIWKLLVFQMWYYKWMKN